MFARTHERRHYWFEFGDGCTFSTLSAPRGVQLEERARLAAYVAERAGIEISEAPIVTL